MDGQRLIIVPGWSLKSLAIVQLVGCVFLHRDGLACLTVQVCDLLAEDFELGAG